MVTRPGVTRIAFFLLIGLVASASTTKSKASAPKAKTAASAVAHRPVAQKSTAKAPSKSTARNTSSRTPARRTSSSSPAKPTYRKVSSPIAPASDRIREVQQALIDRGFLTGTPSGTWNAESIDALKKFETAQNLKVDGKIDSKALIQLGLGPQYDRNLALPVPSAGGAVLADDNRLQLDPQRLQ